jgi:hypothetical protein
MRRWFSFCFAAGKAARLLKNWAWLISFHFRRRRWDWLWFKDMVSPARVEWQVEVPTHSDVRCLCLLFV